MPGKSTDEKMTHWISGYDSPCITGYYEIRIRTSPQIANALFTCGGGGRGGFWQIEYANGFSPFSYGQGQFEWRGLNFEPKVSPLLPRGSRVFVFDGR
jgi:hypothetical protein